MSTRKAAPKASVPTDAELAILEVLWARGPCTVRDVHETLEPVQRTGYTTVLKLMQIMAEKGLVKRDERQRSHVYRPVPGQEQTQKKLLGDLMDRAFSGSASQLVMRALSVKPASADDLARIRAMLDAMESGEET